MLLSEKVNGNRRRDALGPTSVSTAPHLRSSGPVRLKPPSHAPRTISDPPTQAQVQALNDGLVTVITLLNELRVAAIENGLIKGGV